jgi:twitching motility two-component system response regulator PilH
MTTRNEIRKTILVVEDSPTQAMHVQRLLEGEGANVVLALDGEAGVQLAREIKPDLIVLDIRLPKLDGFQVCEELQKEQGTACIPIILLTRVDDPEVASLGVQSGVVDYIPKDAFADAVLLETLRQMGLVNSSSLSRYDRWEP